MSRRITPYMLTWKEDPSDPDRPAPGDGKVLRLAADIAPGSPVRDLGGAFSLNLLLEETGQVLRVHQPFMIRARLVAQQQVRREISALGVSAPVPLSHGESTVVRCGSRWAELEPYLPHTMLPPIVDSYEWLFDAMGTLHRALDRVTIRVPRPYFATYGPPGTLRRWLPITEAAVRHHQEAAAVASELRHLVGRLHRHWVPARDLPHRLVHGDVKLRNVGIQDSGETIFLDFGFMAHRPRIHEHAYALTRMLLTLGYGDEPDSFDWTHVTRLLTSYQRAAGVQLGVGELQALPAYTAAAALYQGATSGFMTDPAETLLDDERRRLMNIARFVLTNPDALG